MPVDTKVDGMQHNDQINIGTSDPVEEKGSDSKSSQL